MLYVERRIVSPCQSNLISDYEDNDSYRHSALAIRQVLDTPKLETGRALRQNRHVADMTLGHFRGGKNPLEYTSTYRTLDD